MLSRRSISIAIAISLVGVAQPEIAIAQSCPAEISGQYRVQGRNADGSTYQGYAGINQNGSAVAMAWKVGNQEYDGTGKFKMCTLTVNWGAGTPVIYKVLPNGEMDGTWDSGQASEMLVPR